MLRDGIQRIIVHLAPGKDGNLRIHEADQLPQDPALGLAPEPQEYEIMPGKESVDQLGDHGILVSQDAGEEGIAFPNPPDEVGPDLILHRQSPGS